MGARDFVPASNSIVAGTITAIDTGDWTWAGWFNADSVTTPSRALMWCETTGAGLCQTVLIDSTSSKFRAIQGVSSGTQGDSVASNLTAVISVDTCVIVSYRDSDGKLRIYVGNRTTPMAEVTYGTQTARSGTRRTAGTRYSVGNDVGSTTTDFDGRIARPAFDAREWSDVERELFRLGARPVQNAANTLRVFWPFDSPTAAQVEDLSGYGVTGTVTAAGFADGPPIPHTLTPVAPVLFSVAAPTTFDGTADLLAEGFLSADGELLEVWDGTGDLLAEGFLSATGELLEVFSGEGSFIAEGFLSASGQLVRASATIRFAAERGLGCGTIEVYAYERGGLVLKGLLPYSQVTFGRSLDDMSSSNVSVSDECGIFSDLRSWEHEIRIDRDGIPEAWVGPIIGRSLRSRSITARDWFQIFERRILTADVRYLNTDLGEIFLRLAELALLEDDSANIDLQVRTCGILGDRIIGRSDQRRAADELREIARGGLDFTMIGRTLLAGGVEIPIEPLPLLTTDAFLDDLDAEELGLETASRVFVRGDQTSDVVPVEGVASDITGPFGLLDFADIERTIRDTLSATVAAQTRLDLRAIPPMLVTGTLSPQAPVEFHQLVPGARCDLRVMVGQERIEGTYRLASVNVTATNSDQGYTEAVSVQFQPLGTVEG